MTSSFRKSSITFALGACLALLPTSGHAGPWKRLRGYRVKYRKSAACASALSAVRALSTDDAGASIGDHFTTFTQSWFTRPARGGEAKVVTATSRQISAWPSVHRRLAAVARTLEGRGNELERVIARAHLSSDDRIRQFLELVDGARADIDDRAWAAYSAGALSQLKSLDFKSQATDLIQYSPVAGGIVTFAGVHLTMLTWLYSLDALTAHFGDPHFLPTFAITGALTAAGANDFPVRWYRSWGEGLTGLRDFFERASKNGRDWAFYSRDWTVSEEFARALVRTDRVEWSALDEENRRETFSGLLRILRDRRRRRAGLGTARISIDVLMTKTDAGHAMSVVLRAKEQAP